MSGNRAGEGGQPYSLAVPRTSSPPHPSAKTTPSISPTQSTEVSRRKGHPEALSLERRKHHPEDVSSIRTRPAGIKGSHICPLDPLNQDLRW